MLGQSRFVLETPGAVAAAKGTTFLTSYEDGKTEVLVAEGVVGLSLIEKSDVETILKGRFAITEGMLPPTLYGDKLFTPSDFQKLKVGNELPSSASQATKDDIEIIKELVMMEEPE